MAGSGRTDSILAPAQRVPGGLAFLDRLLPHEIVADPDDARRGRLFIVMSVVLSASAFFFA
jgi:hypothetical protein